MSSTAARISLSAPNIAGREWEYVKACLDDGWVSSGGAFVTRFENEFAARVGARQAVATSSGTAALHVALILAGVKPGDEVIVPSLTFIAPANTVRYLQAFPVFVDVEPDFWQIDPRSMAAFLADDCERLAEGVVNRRTGRRVRAVIPVDILGHPADLDAIAAIASEYDLALVEDATESLGAAYRGRPLGSVSPLTAFSFNGNKLLTTGGGGMLASPDPAIAERARYLTTQAKDDAVEFVHRQVGYNYRLTNVQAAIGVAQLERIGEFLTRKREIAAIYTERLGRLPGVVPMREAEWATSAFWLYTIRLGPEAPLDRKMLMAALAAEEIETRPLWQPLHRSPAHAGAYARSCPVAERLNDTCLSLPSSTNLTGEQLDRVCESVARAFDRAHRRASSAPQP